ncbi:MAG: hypothetical protein ACPLTR_01420 [Thermacetogeniaceae bacterium]
MWLRNCVQLLNSFRWRYREARLRMHLRKAYLRVSKLSFDNGDIWEKGENLLLLRVSKERGEDPGVHEKGKFLCRAGGHLSA